jgi:C4-dicarboxylate transporter DctM subunit
VPTTPFSWPAARLALRRGIWSLLLPVIILGGIYSGVFTATEAAAVSVVYAFVIEIFVHQELDAKKLMGVATTSMTVMGALLVIIALAITLNYFLVLEGVPDLMVEWLKGLDLDVVAFLIVVNLLLLVVGCFMDIMSAILIIAPMLAPMAMAMHIHPIHMAIIFIVNLEIGYLTPPVGLNLFVSSTLFKKSLGFVIKSVIPTLVIMLVSLMIITWWPGMSLGLLRMMGSDSVASDVPTPVEPSGPMPGGDRRGARARQDARGADGGHEGQAGRRSGCQRRWPRRRRQCAQAEPSQDDGGADGRDEGQAGHRHRRGRANARGRRGRRPLAARQRS